MQQRRGCVNQMSAVGCWILAASGKPLLQWQALDDGIPEGSTALEARAHGGCFAVSPAIPTNPGASPTEIAEVNQVLEANGYTDIAVLSGDDQIVTASAIKDGKKSVVDVDPITGIILPHIDLPPMPAQLASVADLTQTRAGGGR